MDTAQRAGVGPVLACLAAAALFGASTPASKELLEDLGPLTLASALYLGAGVAAARSSRSRASRGVSTTTSPPRSTATRPKRSCW